MKFDYVVILCDNANEACSFFPANTKVFHRVFYNPPGLAEGLRNEEEALNHYRRVRDGIKAFWRFAKSIE
jgi:arsenate reductase (thioredoxin)